LIFENTPGKSRGGGMPMTAGQAAAGHNEYKNIKKLPTVKRTWNTTAQAKSSGESSRLKVNPYHLVLLPVDISPTRKQRQVSKARQRKRESHSSQRGME
jgi:hypothetical protein